MKIRSMILTLFLTICFSGYAQIDAFHQEIINLLKINGTEQEYGILYRETLDIVRTQFSWAEVPDEFWMKLHNDKAESVDEAISLLSFAYRNHFTRDEINSMFVFYQTKAAQKMVMNNNESTPEEKKEIEVFFNSEVGKKIAKSRVALAYDISEISKEWRKDVFSKGMSALVKSGYITN